MSGTEVSFSVPNTVRNSVLKPVLFSVHSDIDKLVHKKVISKVSIGGLVFYRLF